jgi:diguanylate cyclase (GGDEF)-like protein/PAS domain S-box-containing protein
VLALRGSRRTSWWATGDAVPPRLAAGMAAHLTETIELVDDAGIVRWYLGASLGRPEEPATGRSAFSHVHASDLPTVLEHWASVVRGSAGDVLGVVARVSRPDAYWPRCSIDLLDRRHDPDVGAVVVRTRLLDPTRLEVRPADGAVPDLPHESIADLLPVALAVLDRHGRMQFVNHAARELCDLPAGPSNGRNLADLAIDGDRAALGAAVRSVWAHGTSRTVTFTTRGWRGRGEPRLVEARLLARGRGDQTTITASLEDVTERQREEAELRRRASSDPLTGLLSRTAFLEEVDALLSQGPITAVYCDLDGFKAVNDTHGHGQGDEVLKAVADRLRQVARSTDVVGRLGGDEFVIACAGLGVEHVATLVARLDESVDEGLGVRISVGVATAHAGGSAAELLARADRAMYVNKRRRKLDAG